MRRDLDYSLWFGEGNDFRLRRMMTLDESTGLDMQESFVVANTAIPGVRVAFTPAELAELHEAIHEMLRLHDTHVDALTDGAGAVAGESEAPTLDVVSATMLAHLGDGGTLYRNNGTRTFYLEVDDCAYVHRSHAEQLIDRGLVSQDLSSPCSPESLTRYVISDAGRRVLAESDDGG